MQCLIDLLLLPVGYGDQDFGQVVGGPEFEGITPDQAIGGLVARDVVDNVGGARAAALDERFEFETAWFLDSAVASMARISFGKLALGV